MLFYKKRNTFVPMRKSKEIPEQPYNQDFIAEYEKIINTSSINSVIVKTEWNRRGDFFQKLSLYDNSYAPIITFGGTTCY